MNRALQRLLVAILPLTWVGHGQEAETKSPFDTEKRGIDKIALLTAKEHSTILFTIADSIVRYAQNGPVERVASRHSPRRAT
jgi:hypothetical protein